MMSRYKHWDKASGVILINGKELSTPEEVYKEYPQLKYVETIFGYTASGLVCSIHDVAEMRESIAIPENVSEKDAIGRIIDHLENPQDTDEPPDYVTLDDLAEMLGLDSTEPDLRKAIAETLSDVALVSQERKLEQELEPGIIDKPIKSLGKG